MNNRTFTRNGKIATLKKARKNHTCCVCHSKIGVDDHYWHIIYAGSGVRSMVYPERVCVNCLEVKMGRTDAESNHS